MIEDIEGADRSPSRRTHMRVISVVLAVAALAGYAAASSPRFQGPFATPDPNPLALAMLKSTVPTTVDNVTFSRSDAIFCSPIAYVASGPALVASRPVIVERGPAPITLTTTVYSQDGKNVVAVIGYACTPGEVRTSFDRFAR